LKKVTMAFFNILLEGVGVREFEWIQKAAALFGRKHEGVPVGIGDDCAVLDCAGSMLVSIDTVVDGVHLDRRLLAPEDVGWRALATALSDLAANGADVRRPISALISLQCPADFVEAELLRLATGVRECAEAHGCRVVGGDTVRTPGPMALTVAVIGSSDRPVLRRGARPGDLLAVTGPLGSAGVGLHALRRGLTDEHAQRCAAAYRRPAALLATGAVLSQRATAMIDISDGLLQDLGHLCAASEVGATVDLDRVPIDAAAREVAARLGLDAVEIAASFGDDYQLLACLHPSGLEPLQSLAPGLTVIGEMRAAPGVEAQRGGRPYEPQRRGYEHEW
jgi:thiamine-monophosphate kinase